MKPFRQLMAAVTIGLLLSFSVLAGDVHGGKTANAALDGDVHGGKTASVKVDGDVHGGLSAIFNWLASLLGDVHGG